jgi:transposase-like protein
MSLEAKLNYLIESSRKPNHKKHKNKSRKNHLHWGTGDIEIHQPKSRKNHLHWGIEDVEIHQPSLINVPPGKLKGKIP